MRCEVGCWIARRRSSFAAVRECVWDPAITQPARIRMLWKGLTIRFINGADVAVSIRKHEVVTTNMKAYNRVIMIEGFRYFRAVFLACDQIVFEVEMRKGGVLSKRLRQLLNGGPNRISSAHGILRYVQKLNATVPQSLRQPRKPDRAYSAVTQA